MQLKKIKIGIVLSTLLYLLMPVAVAQSPSILEAYPTLKPELITPKSEIIRYAEHFEISPEELIKVAQCESNMGLNLKGDFNGSTYLAIGLFMYHDETWTRMSNLYKKYLKKNNLVVRNLDKNNITDQAEVTAFIFAKYPKSKNEWSTYVAYKKGGTYTFFSKVLNRTFTVTCK